MSRKNRTTKDNVGIVYLFTNKLYERENMYKYGITINPFQRKRVQSNSTPPPYHFYDRIVLERMGATMTKRAIIVCACEIACCLIGGVVARIIITIIKNIVRNYKKSVDSVEML